MPSTLTWNACLLTLGAVLATGCTGQISGNNGRDGSTLDSDVTSMDPDSGHVVGVLDGSPTDVLPPLPALTNVRATEYEDSVGIDFDPVDNAVDYRVYPLPRDGDVTVHADQSITITNGTYRCAGFRQTYDLPNGVSNPRDVVPQDGQQYFNPNQQFSWGAIIPANPTVGYVHVVAGDGLVPVYAVGVHAGGYELGWNESRPKIYTTDAAQRQSLLAHGGRDDGIVFYTPATASAATRTIYHSETGSGTGNSAYYAEYYFTSTDMAARANDTIPPSPAFQVLTAADDGAVPLMALFYQPGQNHTELAVGNERFKRAANQGPGPLWHLEWSGITEPTTLVVEALATGCPFQGFLSPEANHAPPHQPLLTIDQIRQASPTGEVFLNGQFDLPGTTFTIMLGNGAMGGMWGVSDAGAPILQTPNSSPIPIARSYIRVSPHPHDPNAWDWYQGFNVGTALPPLTPLTGVDGCACQPTSDALCIGGGGACGFFTSPVFNVGAVAIDHQNGIPVFAYGQSMGQLYDVFDDVAQDVGGLVRMTAAQMATVNADSFLHVTWSVDVVGTHRRYPQIAISDQQPPVLNAQPRPDSNTLLIQTFSASSIISRLEAQAFHGLVNGSPWNVNNQAPLHAFIDEDTWNVQGPDTSAMPPTVALFEHSGMDRLTHFDAYISSSRLYLFLDGTPAGCTLYPPGNFTIGGPVTVTFGDVLYHESASDEGVCSQSHPFVFMHEHQCSETKRHWDDLGFRSGVPAPTWDETRFPCGAY